MHDHRLVVCSVNNMDYICLIYVPQGHILPYLIEETVIHFFELAEYQSRLGMNIDF